MIYTINITMEDSLGIKRAHISIGSTPSKPKRKRIRTPLTPKSNICKPLFSSPKQRVSIFSNMHNFSLSYYISYIFLVLLSDYWHDSFLTFVRQLSVLWPNQLLAHWGNHQWKGTNGHLKKKEPLSNLLELGKQIHNIDYPRRQCGLPSEIHIVFGLMLHYISGSAHVLISYLQVSLM